MLTLLSQDRAFLEENFDVFDLATGARSKDFSNFLKAKIVLLGEFHHSGYSARMRDVGD